METLVSASAARYILLISHTTQAGEVWHEVAGELAQEGLRPVTPDQEMLQEVLHSHEEKAENTLRLQVHPNTLWLSRLIVCIHVCSQN